jgi:hypothetical protein
VSVASKLQVKPGQRVAVLRRPPGVDLGIAPADVHDDPSTADAVIVSVESAGDLATDDGDAVVETAARDALAWAAYPKAVSSART